MEYLGDNLSANQLFADVYARLKAMAARSLPSRERGTLDTAELVHDLYLRLSSNRELRFEQSAQFLAYAARAMRHLLMDRARNELRLRASGGWTRVTLSEDDLELASAGAEEALELRDALTRLAHHDERAALVVALRYFVGLSLEQVADVLGVARRTVDRDWRFARAFLQEQLRARM